MRDEIMASMLPLLIPVLAFIFLVSIWELVWKGIALWKAAQREHKGWFIAILLLNTMGLLPILYIFLVASRKKSKKR
jgi:hypothetical protein